MEAPVGQEPQHAQTVSGGVRYFGATVIEPCMVANPWIVQ